MVQELPRRVWLYWHQGYSQAPDVVKVCYQSWVSLNPGWEITFLDADSVKAVLPDVEITKLSDNISLNYISDLIRLSLLNRFGGVWADATVYCSKPLDLWVKEVSHSGFFCFRNPGRDRFLSTWFLVANKETPIINDTLSVYHDFLLAIKAFKKTWFRRNLVKLLSWVLSYNKQTTLFWFNPLLSRVFGVYPYYLVHYCFSRILIKSRFSYEEWNTAPSINADEAMSLIISTGYFAPLDRLISVLETDRVPVFKLSWKIDVNNEQNRNSLEYLSKRATIFSGIS